MLLGKGDPAMNWLLIGILDVLNKLIAIFLVISSAVSGYYGEFGTYAVAVTDPAHRALATVVGLCIGIILAALVSGLLAAIITISREMAAIRAILVARGPSPP